MTAPAIPPSPSAEDYARDYAAALAANSDEAVSYTHLTLPTICSV